MSASDAASSSPLLAYFGHHKCGTTWVNRVFQEACDQLGLRFGEVHNAQMFGRDLPAWVDAEGIDFLAYTNADWHYVEDLFSDAEARRPVRAFHIVRDPRDLVVSGYYSSRYSHPTDVWPELVAHRARLEAATEAEGLLLEMDWNAHVLDHIARWDYARPQILERKLEDLFADEYAVYFDLFEHLGLLASGEHASWLEAGALPPDAPLASLPVTSDGRLDATAVADLVYRSSFAVRTQGRKPGEVDPKSHLRKGEAGDWVNHFDARHRAHFDERWGALVTQLGY